MTATTPSQPAGPAVGAAGPSQPDECPECGDDLFDFRSSCSTPTCDGIACSNSTCTHGCTFDKLGWGSCEDREADA